jgi:hypothetical protein
LQFGAKLGVNTTMSASWKSIQVGGRIARQIVAILRMIPLVDNAVDSVQKKLLNPVVVRLIQDTDDPDLDAALELYRKKIPDDQRFEATDIISWLREDKISRAGIERDTTPTDWFIVAKFRRRVCGFILFHYYPSARLALFAYMVVAASPGSTSPNFVSNTLCSYVTKLLKTRRELTGCRGIVLEVEDPRRETAINKQDECLARVRRFCTLAEMQGFSLRALDFEYKQPKLSTDAPPDTERPMLLLSARLRDNLLHEKSQRSETAELLAFVYTRVYPEGYSTDALENSEYRAYCLALLNCELAKLPGAIRSLSVKQLVAQVRSPQLTRNSLN